MLRTLGNNLMIERLLPVTEIFIFKSKILFLSKNKYKFSAIPLKDIK